MREIAWCWLDVVNAEIVVGIRFGFGLRFSLVLWNLKISTNSKLFLLSHPVDSKVHIKSQQSSQHLPNSFMQLILTYLPYSVIISNLYSLLNSIICINMLHATSLSSMHTRFLHFHHMHIIFMIYCSSINSFLSSIKSTRLLFIDVWEHEIYRNCLEQNLRLLSLLIFASEYS